MTIRIPRPVALALFVAALGWWAVCRLTVRAEIDWDDAVGELFGPADDPTDANPLPDALLMGETR